MKNLSFSIKNLHYESIEAKGLNSFECINHLNKRNVVVSSSAVIIVVDNYIFRSDDLPSRAELRAARFYRYGPR